MRKSPTKIIFLWHMHQPCYRHPQEDYYILPWVRLHGAKDYYGMARTLEKCAGAKASFNFSGVLLQQIMDYAENRAQDYYLILTLKEPSALTQKEKDFIIERFFSVNFERFIRPNERFQQLHNKKLSPHTTRFTDQDIMDLTVLFNLCWFHPYTFQEDKNLRNISRKGRGYSREDKEYIIKKQYEIISRIIPLYTKLLWDKKIDLTVTPYHHPILPLIYDTDILQEFSYLKRPLTRFSEPGDCVWHLQQAQDVFQRAFGVKVKGSWPSEGSVSEDVISLYAQQGFKWVATDEAILFRSLTTDYVSFDMIKNQRQLIYRPYKFKGIDIFFRDRNLSDAISFIYQGWDDSGFAAHDLMEHFKRIHTYIKNISKERVITIIMDGENAWGYYKNNGVQFLETLYSLLDKSDMLSTTTPSQFLARNRSRPLERLASGSWINADFSVWIGNRLNNHYWQILRKVKDLIVQSRKDSQRLEEARKYLYLLEGSDWYWWNTFEDTSGEFKKIFYYYVNKIYTILERKVPAYICRGAVSAPD